MWPNLRPYFLLLPALGVVILLFFGGFVLGFLESVGYFSFANSTQLSLDVYGELLTADDFWRSVSYTLRLSFLSTLLSALLGLVLGLGLARMKGGWQRVLQLPLFIPHLAAAYLMALMFMQSGWISRLFYGMGWIRELQEFPILIHDTFGWGIVLAYVWKESPFIAFMLYPVLKRIHSTWFEAAQVLGANRRQYFWEVVFPLLLPSWLSASFIVFAFTFSAFEVPLLLGVTYPEMVSVMSYKLFLGDLLEDRPKALAVNLLLALITALLGWMAYKLSEGWTGMGRSGWN